MNYLENCQSRYGSNPSMGRTRTIGPDEFEPSKFDCISLNSKRNKDYIFSGPYFTWCEVHIDITFFQALIAHSVKCRLMEVPDTDHFSVIENLQYEDYILTQVSSMKSSV